MVKKLCGKVLGTITENSSTILTVVTVIGIGATAVLCSRATIKAEQILKEETKRREEDAFERGKAGDISYPEEITKKDVVKLCWKSYIPTFVVGSVTIGAAIGAHLVDVQKVATITTAYSLAENKLSDLKSSIVGAVGENKAKEIQNKPALEKAKAVMSKTTNDNIFITGNGNTYCFVTASNFPFYSSPERVKRGLEDAMDIAKREMFVSVNELYSALNIPRIQAAWANQMGWTAEIADQYLDWHNVLDSGLDELERPYLCLNIEPKLQRRSYGDF